MAEGGISNKQALIYIGITCACFAALYPSLFHPLVRGLLKWGKTEEESVAKREPPVPTPEQLKRRQGQHRPGRPPLRSGAVPSPNSDPAHGTTGQTQSSGKGGMMGFVLPVYAVGIVVYLVYVVSKVYVGGGKKTKKLEEMDVYETLQKRLSAIDFERVLRGDDQAAMEELTALADQLKQCRQEADGSCSVADKQSEVRHASREKKGTKKQSTDADPAAATAGLGIASDECSLDDLLDQGDQLNNLSSTEMQKLQKKLLEAEAKMARIAEALRKARTEQLGSDCEGVPTAEQDVSSGAAPVTSAADEMHLPDSGTPQMDDDNDDRESDDADATAQVETLTADLDACSSNQDSSPQAAVGVRRRVAAKNVDIDSDS